MPTAVSQQQPTAVSQTQTRSSGTSGSGAQAPQAAEHSLEAQQPSVTPPPEHLLTHLTRPQWTSLSSPPAAAVAPVTRASAVTRPQWTTFGEPWSASVGLLGVQPQCSLQRRHSEPVQPQRTSSPTAKRRHSEPVQPAAPPVDSTDSGQEQEEAYSIGDVFTGFEMHLPVDIPAGTEWRPWGAQGSYMLEQSD